MKKLFLTFGLITMSSAAFAQGSVNWGSISFVAMTVETNGPPVSPIFGGGGGGGPVAPAGGYYFELLYQSYTGVQAPVPDSLGALLSWSDTGLEATNVNTAGRLMPINPNFGALVPWSPGTTDSIVLVGWSANLGSTWSAAEAELANFYNDWVPNAYLGFSATGYITPLATTTSPGTTVFGTGPTAQGVPIYNPPSNPMVLYLIPEPCTLALAGLGGLSLLLFRRRK
ncbi:MAG: hypothetical protein WBW41_14440 [Verrucomicrobiia bacterium]